MDDLCFAQAEAVAEKLEEIARENRWWDAEPEVYRLLESKLATVCLEAKHCYDRFDQQRSERDLCHISFLDWVDRLQSAVDELRAIEPEVVDEDWRLTH